MVPDVDAHRAILATMAIPVIELDTSRLRGFLAERQIEDAARLRSLFAADSNASYGALDLVKLAYANDTALELFGATSSESLSGEVGRIWPDDGQTAFQAKLAAMVEHRPSFKVDTMFRHLDGSDLPVLYTSWSPTGDLHSDRLFVALIDIRERIRTEETLSRVRADLAHAGRLSVIGELTASITHEVTQPLSAVEVAAKAGLRWLSLDQPDLGEARTAFERIVVAGRRALDVVTRMRSMSKKQQVELVPLSANALIQETALFLRHELATHQTSLRLDLTDSTDEVLADRTQIQQVLVNLMMNAAQAMSNARCWRRVLSLRSRGDRDNRLLTVELEDTGPGISPADQQKLFDSFFTTKAEGMGMGLSICRSIVEEHGGSVTVKSRVALGTTFSFTLLLAEQGRMTERCS